ncbi:hypothetical protein K7X08_023747 [Anisodus acutangulus]|uniref:F-box/LRR-repeat protein 15/At3g58940/PEG3-like LRR domain-containing protein n=1 Tax=Anisodus acutangulus TaxID=402998 RepID=A0A9Q1L8P6_9SOLA|nr:hypothetical protein K7X08_023747 [Anisodus acutangulus]
MASGDSSKDDGSRSGNSSNLKKQKVIEVEDRINIQVDHNEFVDYEEHSCRDYHHVFRTFFQDYLKKLSNVTELTIGTWFTESTARDCSFCHNFVDYVFAHSVSPKLKKLKLDCSRFWPYSRCLNLAVEKNVENVVFSSLHESACTLPESFYSCSSLITLDSECSFNYDEVIAWKPLKSIKLNHMVLKDDEIVNLLSGCPALETMELDTVEGFRRMEIKSLKLKQLSLKEYWIPSDGNDHSLEIMAPYLQHLEISGDLFYLKCRLVDVSSVVNAKLTFSITCIKDL